MKINLKVKPRNPIIIEGFPGFGFVSTIASEFLIKHLDAKRIGSINSSKLTPMAAIHGSEIINPLEIHYAKKQNIIIIRSLTNIAGAEWEIADMIIDLAKQLKAKEVISIEGIANDEDEKLDVYYFTKSKDREKKFEKIKVKKLKDGIIIGVSGALILKADEIPLSCVFVEANPGLPDSRAAGEAVKALDAYLGLKVDYKPLVKTAEEFESKLKDLIMKAKKATNMKEEKEAGYLG